MALVAESQGTQTCTLSTPHTLAAPTTNKTRLLRLDLFNLTPGEVLRVEIRTKVLTTGTLRNEFDQSYIGPVGNPIMSTVPISGELGATFIITLVSGTTGRLVDWKVLTLD